MASASSTSGVTSETRDKHGLCLLSLDGGGVRGLSTLLILKRIMQQINAKRQSQGMSHVRPCDVFDLIGGTSTGGLVAIMLGRLQMDIQPSIDAYSELSRRIFCNRGLPVDWRGKITGRYEASELEDAVRKIIKDSGSPEDASLDDGKDRGCRVFVCAVRKENKAVARIRSYQSDIALVEDGAKIWEAARATSAASGFFDPISIGQHGQEYVDAGLGCNNPVDECFISIGTGNPGTSPVEDSALKIFSKTLKEIATETEKTAELFEKRNRGLFFQERYFRFNVDQGLQSVGLEEYKKEKEIVSATSLYMESLQMQTRVRKCSLAMKDKEFWKSDYMDMMRLILREHQQGREHFQLVFSLAAAPEIDYFVGRASSLSSIESVLLPFTAAERKVVVLRGLGGIGKSQLAIEFAKKHRLDYTAVLWLNAKTEDTLKGSFAANARRLPKEIISQELLYGPQNEEGLGTILREMKAWLGLPGNDRWLLIYDNVDNPKIPDNKRQHAYDIRLYFPEAHQGSILVTTRWKTLRIGYPIEVAKLSKDEDSISLLEQTSGRNLGQDLRIKDLTKKLDGLPLALATAGAYLGLSSMSVSEYLHHHETSWLELQRTSPRLLSYEDQTIYSTWNLSYIHIRKEDEPAAKLIELWAYFDNQDLWYDLLEAGNYDWAPAWFDQIVGTKLAFQAAIGKLQKHALIESLIESDGYSMHHCVHAWVKNVLCKTIEEQYMRLALTCVGESVPWAPAPGDWIIKQRLFPHSERCLQLLRVWNDGSKDPQKIEDYAIPFYGNLGTLYRDQGKLVEAESMYQRALAGKEKALGRDHTSTLQTVNNLGNIYWKQGKLIEAESMYQRALTGTEKALGRDHTSTLDTVNNLGIVYRKQGKLVEAESMYQRALAGYEKALGRDHTSTLQTVNNLGIVYWKQDKLVEAESMYQRALTGYEKALGRDHTSTLDTVNNLGIVYWKQGKLVEAESMYQRAFTGKEKALGRDHTSTLGTVHNLGNIYCDQGKLVEAESMYQRALTGYEKALGRDHTSTLGTVHNLGNIYCDQGKLVEAESMYQRALTGKEKALGRDHTSTLGTVHNLGNIYRKQGKLVEAESMYQRALTGTEKALGRDHTSTLDVVNNLGSVYRDQGNLKEAESMYQRALTGTEKALGRDHTSTLDVVNNLGSVYRDQGNLKEAESMYQRALTGTEKALGRDHTSTLGTVNNLGTVYRDQGKLVEAESMYQRALAGYEKALGRDHTSTLGTVNNLGIVYRAQGRLTEAESMFQRALTGYTQNPPPNAKPQLDLFYNTGLLSRDLQKFERAKGFFNQAYEGYEKLLGSQHAETIDALDQLNIEIERNTQGAERSDGQGVSVETY